MNKRVPQEIEFVIKPDGSLEYTIKGMKGAGCDEVSLVFEELGEQTEVRRTSEYYEKEQNVKLKGKQNSRQGPVK